MCLFVLCGIKKIKKIKKEEEEKGLCAKKKRMGKCCVSDIYIHVCMQMMLLECCNILAFLL